MKKDLLSVSDLSSKQILSLISDTVNMKAKSDILLPSKNILALIFEKPSLRTRVSFEVAIAQLGGQAIYLSPSEVGLGNRESVSDVVRVLSRYVDAIAARTFSHSTLEAMSNHSSIPVINALSDLEHPCQALADLVTIYEKKGKLGGLSLAFVGDGNNVAHSLLLAASLTGMNFSIASPSGYTIQENILYLSQTYAKDSGAEILCVEEPSQAVNGADIVYTDVWTSMGQENEAQRRRQIFKNYQVNGDLLSSAKEDVIIMHPLPAHHGEEIAKDILDSPKSVVFDQAENRMHLQKALLAQIFGSL